MNTRHKMISQTEADWRALGFYYDRDDENHEWIIVGSKDGLIRFCECLKSYASDESNIGISEHDHYGPYSYLKIMTWSELGISQSSIHGSLSDLLRLSKLIQSKLDTTRDDSIVIADEYVPGCDYKIVLKVMDDGFDPASPDSMAWADRITRY